MNKYTLFLSSALAIALVAQSDASRDQFDDYGRRVPSGAPNFQQGANANQDLRQQAVLPADFDPIIYLEINRDLFNDFLAKARYIDGKTYARNHYIKDGQREGRAYRYPNVPVNFDAQAYLKQNKDVEIAAQRHEAGSLAFARLHYSRDGHAEGRQCPLLPTQEEIAAREKAERDARLAREAEQRQREAEAARLKAELEANRRADEAAEAGETKRIAELKEKVNNHSYHLPWDGNWRTNYVKECEPLITERIEMLKSYLNKNSLPLRDIKAHVIYGFQNDTLLKLEKLLKEHQGKVRRHEMAKKADQIRRDLERDMVPVLGLWKERVEEELHKEANPLPYNMRPLTAGSHWIGIRDTDTKLVRLLGSDEAKAFAETCRAANQLVAHRQVLRLNNKISDQDFEQFMVNKKFVQVLDITRCTQLNPVTVLRRLLDLRHLRVLEANRRVFVEADLANIRGVCPWIQTINLVDPPVQEGGAQPGAAAHGYASRLNMTAIYAYILEQVRLKRQEQIRRQQEAHMREYIENTREGLGRNYYLDARGKLETEEGQLKNYLRLENESQQSQYAYDYMQEQQEAAREHNLAAELQLLQQIRADRDNVIKKANKALIDARIAQIQRELAAMPARQYNYNYARK